MVDVGEILMRNLKIVSLVLASFVVNSELLRLYEEFDIEQ